MLKRRTVIQTLFLSTVFGMLSFVPYQLEQNDYAVHSALMAVGWVTLTLSILALMYSFLSVVASTMMWVALSIPGGFELLVKARNPYRIVAWKEACESYEEIAQRHRQSSDVGINLYTGRGNMDKPDLHFRNWMRPYLPSDVKYRDMVLMLLGVTLVGIVSITIMKFNEIIGIGLLALGIGHFGGHYRLRAINRFHSRKKK